MAPPAQWLEGEMLAYLQSTSNDNTDFLDQDYIAMQSPWLMLSAI